MTPTASSEVTGESTVYAPFAVVPLVVQLLRQLLDVQDRLARLTAESDDRRLHVVAALAQRGAPLAGGLDFCANNIQTALGQNNGPTSELD